MPPVPAEPDAPVGAPLYPPADWFSKPASLQPGQKITVVTDGPEAGRVFGYVAPKAQCILSGREKQECWQVPDSPTNYAAAMQGETLTAEGELVRTANIGGEVDHAPITWRSFQKVRDHYANTASQVMRVTYGSDEHGVWAAGALWPEITHRQAAKVRASALSGDWRWREEFGAYDMAGSQMVSTPGLPLIPTIHARAASLGDPHPPLIGGWGGLPTEEPMAPEPQVTLTLTATETARLHALLSGGAPMTVNNAFTAAPGACACGGHQAAPGDLASMPGEEVDPAGPVTRAEFDALALTVQELQGEIMANALGEVDAMVAALPLPPDLEDEDRWRMPEARTAAFDESKVKRVGKGNQGGGRFTFKTTTANGQRSVMLEKDGEWVNGTTVEDTDEAEAEAKRELAADDGLDPASIENGVEGDGRGGSDEQSMADEHLEANLTGDPFRDAVERGEVTDGKAPGAKAKGSDARVVDTSDATLRELAAGDGRIDPMDPRIQEVAKAQGIPPGKVVEQANAMKRRQQDGTEGDFQKRLADSESQLENEDIVDSLARGAVTPRAAQDAADKLGDAEVERIVGPGGLSGATKEQLAKLMDEARKARA